jgi:hypothetical protein
MYLDKNKVHILCRILSFRSSCVFRDNSAEETERAAIVNVIRTCRNLFYYHVQIAYNAIRSLNNNTQATKNERNTKGFGRRSSHVQKYHSTGQRKNLKHSDL